MAMCERRRSARFSIGSQYTDGGHALDAYDDFLDPSMFGVGADEEGSDEDEEEDEIEASEREAPRRMEGSAPVRVVVQLSELGRAACHSSCRPLPAANGGGAAAHSSDLPKRPVLPRTSSGRPGGLGRLEDDIRAAGRQRVAMVTPEPRSGERLKRLSLAAHSVGTAGAKRTSIAAAAASKLLDKTLVAKEVEAAEAAAEAAAEMPRGTCRGSEAHCLKAGGLRGGGAACSSRRSSNASGTLTGVPHTSPWVRQQLQRQGSSSTAPALSRQGSSRRTLAEAMPDVAEDEAYDEASAEEHAKARRELPAAMHSEIVAKAVEEARVAASREVAAAKHERLQAHQAEVAQLREELDRQSRQSAESAQAIQALTSSFEAAVAAASERRESERRDPPDSPVPGAAHGGAQGSAPVDRVFVKAVNMGAAELVDALQLAPDPAQWSGVQAQAVADQLLDLATLLTAGAQAANRSHSVSGRAEAAEELAEARAAQSAAQSVAVLKRLSSTMGVMAGAQPGNTSPPPPPSAPAPAPRAEGVPPLERPPSASFVGQVQGGVELGGELDRAASSWAARPEARPAATSFSVAVSLDALLGESEDGSPRLPQRPWEKTSAWLKAPAPAPAAVLPAAAHAPASEEATWETL